MENLMDIYIKDSKDNSKKKYGRIIFDNKKFEGIIGEEGNYQLVFGKIEDSMLQLSDSNNNESIYAVKRSRRSYIGNNDDSEIRIYPADLIREETPSEKAYVKREIRRLKMTCVNK